MTFITVAARLGLVATAAFTLSSCFGGGGPLQAKPHAKEKLFALIHRGMSRADFYDAARKADVAPVNTDYIKMDKHGGGPIQSGEFPMPDSNHSHPPVSIFINYTRNGCNIPTDEIDVSFDSNDRVAKWTTRRFNTGGCP